MISWGEANFGMPIYERPVALVLYREDHRFLLDSIIPRAGRSEANFDLVIASQPYRAKSSVNFRAKRIIAPLARALRAGGRLIGIHSYGHAFLRGDCYHRIQRRIPRVGYQKKCQIKRGRAEQLACSRTQESGFLRVRVTHKAQSLGDLSMRSAAQLRRCKRIN